MSKYTQGIAFDGAVILEDGKKLTIEEILFKLNNSDVEEVLRNIHDILIDKGFDCYNDDGSLKEVDEYKLTFKDVRLEIEKYFQ